MKTERELFEDWAKERGLTRTRCEDTGVYFNQKTLYAWEAWQASASREGYKLMPLNPTKEMYHAGTHELTQIDFRDLHDDDSVAVYKAMIGAVNDH